jgi:hypothetical protein
MESFSMRNSLMIMVRDTGLIVRILYAHSMDSQGGTRLRDPHRCVPGSSGSALGKIIGEFTKPLDDFLLAWRTIAFMINKIARRLSE